MSNYSVQIPLNSKLKPYIEEFVRIDMDYSEINFKDIIPHPGAFLIISNKNLIINDILTSKNFLIGISDKVFQIKWPGNDGFGLVVKFSGYGLSRFIKKAHISKSLCSSGVSVFGEEFKLILEEVIKSEDFTLQCMLLEIFFSDRFIAPSLVDSAIFQLADELKNTLGTICLTELRNLVHLSKRQLERRFRQLIGVNMLTYRRICKFDTAKSLLFDNPSQLTRIGYDAGYCDQAHFSNEFKYFSNHRPKNFLRFSPFYKIILPIFQKRLQNINF
jgi:AraC-like DNA-binding protein